LWGAQVRHNNVCVRGQISDIEVIGRILYLIPSKPGEKFHSIAQDIQKELGKDEAKLLKAVRAKPENQAAIVKKFTATITLEDVVNKLVAYYSQFPDDDNTDDSDDEEFANVTREATDTEQQLATLTKQVADLALVVRQ